MLDFELLSPIRGIEVIAAGSSIRDRPRLVQKYGHGRWRKLKGYATVRLAGGSAREAELHWYEAHGRGRFEMRIKVLL